MCDRQLLERPCRLSAEDSEKIYQACPPRLLGAFFGYPPCCVAWFNVMNHALDYEDEINLGFLGTGLRACPECCKLPFLQVYRQIQFNRFCHTPFPVEPSDDPKKLHPRFVKFLKRVVRKYQCAELPVPEEITSILENQESSPSAALSSEA